MMNEKILKAIHDLKSAIDSFNDLNPDEKRTVVEEVFGASAIQEIMRLQNIIFRNRRF